SSHCDNQLDKSHRLCRLSPYDQEIAEPLFRTEWLTVESATAMGGCKHLRLSLRDVTGRAEAVWFGLGALAAELPRGTRCQAVFVPMRNEWQGEARLQLKLKGVRAG